MVRVLVNSINRWFDSNLGLCGVSGGAIRYDMLAFALGPLNRFFDFFHNRLSASTTQAFQDLEPENIQWRFVLVIYVGQRRYTPKAPTACLQFLTMRIRFSRSDSM